MRVGQPSFDIAGYDVAMIRLMLLLPGVLLMVIASAHAAPASSEFVLEFPADRAIGTLETRPSGKKYATRWEEAWKDWGDKTDARGMVRVPAEHEVKLTINLAASGDLVSLRKPPPNVIRCLVLSSGRLSDSDWESVLRMTTLRHLYFGQVELNEAGLGKLDRLVSLRVLEVGGVKFGNAIAAATVKMTWLEELNFGTSGLTDAGMSDLGKQTWLKAIRLGQDDITDAASPGSRR